MLDLLGDEGLMEAPSEAEMEPEDLTQDPLNFPAGRDLRLQNLARGAWPGNVGPTSRAGRLVARA